MIYIAVFSTLLVGSSIAYDVTGLMNSMKDNGETNVVIHSKPLGLGDLESLRRALNSYQITTLSLHRNRMTNTEASALAKILIPSNTTHLDISFNQISDSGVESLAAVLNKTNIKTLILDYNSIGYRGVKALAGVLEFTGITYLSLRGNEIMDSGVKELAKILDGTQITGLGLADTFMELVGAQAIAEVLGKTGITYLDLSWNSIYKGGAFKLADALEGTKISDLRLKYTRIGGDGGKAIARILGNTGITHLDLSDNEISDGAGRAIADILKDTLVTELNVTKNEIHPETVVFIESVLEGNRKRIKRIHEQIQLLVRNKNGSLEFDVDYAHTRKSEYIEFSRIVGRKKRIYIQRFRSEGQTREIEDFVWNIETQLENCLRKSELVLKQFKEFVVSRNGVLEFMVERALTNESDYIEFAEIVGKNKLVYVERFVTEGGRNYSIEMIEKFVENIQTLLEECLRELNHVYSIHQRNGDRLEILIVINEQETIESQKSIGNSARSVLVIVICSFFMLIL